MLNLLPGVRLPSNSAPHSAHSSDESSLKAIGASCLAEHHGAWSKIKKNEKKKKNHRLSTIILLAGHTEAIQADNGGMGFSGPLTTQKMHSITV